MTFTEHAKRALPVSTIVIASLLFYIYLSALNGFKIGFFDDSGSYFLAVLGCKHLANRYDYQHQNDQTREHGSVAQKSNDARVCQADVDKIRLGIKKGKKT